MYITYGSVMHPTLLGHATHYSESYYFILSIVPLQWIFADLVTIIVIVFAHVIKFPISFKITT